MKMKEYRLTIPNGEVIKIYATTFKIDDHNNLWFFDGSGWSIRNARHWVGFFETPVEILER